MKNGIFAFVLVLLAAVVGFGQTTFYFPHIANGAGWKTTIFLTNPAAIGTATASGSITFWRDNPNDPTSAGTPYTISFVDETGAPASGGGATIAFQIAGGQTKKFTSTGTGGYAGGFAVVTANSVVSGTAVFSEFDQTGKLIGEAGVPSGTAVTKQAIFVDSIGGYNVGLAFANPGNAAANVTLKLLNNSAVTVVSTTQILGANNHSSHFINELFPSTQIQPLAGTMQVTSDIPLPAIALRFDPSLSVFTTLPPVTLASLVSQPFNALARVVLSLHLRFA